MKKLGLIVLAVLLASSCNAQDSAAPPPVFAINGYIKSLQTLHFNKNFKDLVSGNLVHNRINIKWNPAAGITAAVELRNRLFWGEEVKTTPGFANLLKNENEKVNLQKVWLQNPSLVLHTNTERLYAVYRNNNFNIRLGRQRINWGLTTTWNPNDIFNTYNFLDFDYEERPGSDGLKAQYILTDLFNIEMAYAHTGKKNENVAALKYNLNKWGYDMQIITGWFKEHITLGAGWAGSIKNAGFKGEVQYYFKDRDSANHFNLSIEADNMFKKGWYINSSILYNHRGLYQPVSNWQNIDLKFSPENLMPTKWNLLITTTKEFTPLLTASIGMLYAAGTDLVIILPSAQYNAATNLDVSFTGQSFFARLNKNFTAVNHRFFLRIKKSF